MNYYDRALELKEEIIENRRFLHQNAETGFDLPVTKLYVWQKLEEMGYQPEECGKSGVTVLAGDPDKGKVILLRADMDALPMREESGLSFAAVNGNDHACGHDMHTAMLLGAAKMIKEKEEKLQGAVKFMFQPAEELIAGAKDMIANGILEKPTVDAAMGMHMLPLAPTGYLVYNTEIVSASSDSVDITIHGKGGHGAQPDMCIDPIRVITQLHVALQEIISRETSPEEPVVLSFGIVEAGDARNVIPEKAQMKGTLRAFNPEVREFVLKRIGEMTNQMAEVFRAEGKMEVPASTGSVIVNAEMAEEICPMLRELFGEEKVVHLHQRVNEAEDFSEVSERVPSIFILLGAGSEKEGYHYGLHSPKVRFNEDALPVGTAAYVQAACGWLERQAEKLEVRITERETARQKYI